MKIVRKTIVNTAYVRVYPWGVFPLRAIDEHDWHI